MQNKDRGNDTTVELLSLMSSFHASWKPDANSVQPGARLTILV